MIREFVQALGGGRGAVNEQRSFDAALFEAFGGRSVAGPAVGPGNALESSTVLACVTVLAGDVGQLAMKLYRRMERGKAVAFDHPLYSLLHDEPNPEMTAGTLQETLMGHLLTWGNAYCEIEWGADGYPVALWPLLPDRMTVKRERGALLYEYRPDQTTPNEYRPDQTTPIMLPAYRVLHIPGLSFDGLVGYSPIRLQMQTLSGERAAAEFGWRFFGNGARPGVVLRHPGNLSNEAAGRIRQSWNDMYSGVERSHRAAVLEEGMDITTLGIPPEEAQFLQTRQFTKREIASIYQVPPQRIGDLETATYASAEQFSQDYVKFSLNRWLTRFERAIHAKLLLGPEKREYVVEFERNALIITQTSERFAAYSTGIQSGVLTPNEARERENLNPLPGGDSLLLPLNMVQADQVDASGDMSDDNDADEEGASSEGRGATDALLEAWVGDVRQRLTARIANDVRQGGAKALRNGGRLALQEWGEEQMYDWRQAGETMLAPLRGVDGDLAADVGEWVATAYQAAVKGLNDGDK
jgi:HK97 family phage portal protein